MTKLTSEEIILLRALDGRTRTDDDTYPIRVLINMGYARRLGLGQITITEAGRQRLAERA